MANNIRPTTLLVILVALTSISAQTFQYSRGWINGKRDGHKRNEDAREVARSLEKILSPCQLNKLKYIFEGKPITEKLFAPCEYVEVDEVEIPVKHPKLERIGEHNQEPLYEAFL